MSLDKKTKASVVNVFKTFLKLGLTSFGGPIAHIGYFRKELVERQQWIDEKQFSQLLAICQLLPGPASSQIGFSLGLLRAGWLGALAAFLAFTLPSALLLVIFASSLSLLSNNIGQAAIHGLQLVAVAVVADAVFGMFKKLCPDTYRRAIAIAAASALLLTSSAWSQIIVILICAIAGILICKDLSVAKSDIQVNYSKQLGFILFAIFLGLLLTAIFIPAHSALYAISQAFYQAGALVFGGGHVILPLLEEAVVNPGWVDHADFLVGYGASQAIPGPMFSFSAYLGAIIPSETRISWSGALTALTFMFLPGFLLVSAVLPIWQSIAKNPNAEKAIAGVNAGVVGLLAATLYDPIITSAVSDYFDLIISIIAFSMLKVWRLSPLLVVTWCVIAKILLVWL